MSKFWKIAATPIGAAMLLLTQPAQAQVNTCGNTAQLLSNLIAGCTIGDKLFANFTANVGATDVGALLTFTGAPVLNPLLIGFNLGLPLSLPATVSINTPLVIGYTVTVLDPAFLITDFHLGLTGTTGGLVTETVSSGVNLLAVLSADLDPLTAGIGSTADAFFSGVSSLIVIKNITDLAVFGGGGTVEQRASQTALAPAIPEPASVALVGIGLAGAALARRRKQVAAPL